MHILGRRALGVFVDLTTSLNNVILAGDGVVSSDEFKGQLAQHTDKYDRHRARYFGRIYGVSVYTGVEKKLVPW